MVKLHTEQNNSWSIRNLFNPQTPEQQTQSMMAAQMLTQFFQMAACAGMYSYTPTSTVTPSKKGNNSGVEEANTENPNGVGTPQPEKTQEEKIANFNEFLKKMDVNKEVKTHINELANKYDVFKTGHPDWDDEDLFRRICFLNSALLSHDIQVKYGELYERATAEYIGKHHNTSLGSSDFEEIAKMCENYAKEENDKKGLIDINSDIQKIVDENPGVKLDNSAYAQAIINRGQGYVDMYDSDNNGTVELNEYIELEKTDNGGCLSPEQEKYTKEMFNLIDIDKDNHINGTEMAGWLYAMSRLHDYSENETDAEGNQKELTKSTADITFREWYDSQPKSEDATKWKSEKAIQYIIGLRSQFFSGVSNNLK